jgi:DNA-binding FadR family transcriptional regulator
LSPDATSDRTQAVDDSLASVFFRPVRWQSAFDETVERLAQAIKLGAVPVGAQLPSERQLVEQMQVSRTTLREAIRVLQQRGVLKTRRGRTGGTFVASDGITMLTKAEASRLVQEMGPALTDLIEIRSAIEPKAAELAAERAEPGSVERLRGVLHLSHDAPVTELRANDSLVHIAIAKISASELVMDSVLKVQSQLHELLAFLAVVPTPQVAARAESRQHGKIVEAIARGDAQRAREAMAKHVEATEELLRGVLNFGARPSKRAAQRASSSS